MTVILRDLDGIGEFRAAEDLQRAVWGADDLPEAADLLLALQEEGALVAGAFAGDRMVGYLFGFPTRDPSVQHSHRLAVLPEARGLNLGARLKWYQRDWCLARGVSLVRWTFDPIRRINAGLNIGVLGAIARTYRADLYGAMQGINAGLPSDRLLAEWHLDSPAVAARAAGNAPAMPEGATRSLRLAGSSDAALLADAGQALAERMRLRHELTGAFAAGLAVLGFDRAEATYWLGPVTSVPPQR